VGAGWQLGQLFLLSGRIERLMGAQEGAEAEFRNALGVFRDMGERWFHGLVAIDLARLLLDRERAAATQAAGIDLPEPEAQIDPEWTMKLYAYRALCAAREGRLDDAVVLADRAVLTAERTDQLVFHAEVLVDRATVLARAGRTDEAARSLAEALALYERKGDVAAAVRLRG
jgi:tetratricopeptide (TPR) repeat protein